MSLDEVRSNEATSAARVDFKLEVVVIPVSDAGRDARRSPHRRAGRRWSGSSLKELPRVTAF